MLDSSLLIEYVQDIKYAYFGQAVWGVCLGFILLYFNKLYRRKYLECWAYSLFAFSSLIAFALVSFYTSSVFGVEPFWQSLSFFLYLTATFIHIYWLLRGVRHLTDKNSIRPKAELIFYVASIIIALSVSLFNLFANVEGSFASVQIFPFFVKTLTVGIVFVYAGLKIMRLGRNDGALGKKLLWIAFLLYGFQDLQYAVSCVYLFFDNSYILNIEASMGVIDLLVLSFIGIGMIIWLLEDERSTLEKTNKELDSFLYSTSHDLRAPVASLLGLINIAKHDIKEEQGVKYISMMEERVIKLDHIFSDILNYSRNIKTEINVKTFRLGDIIDDVISDLKFNEGADSIRLDFEEQIDHILRTDYYQLKVVLSNLLSNAVKYHDSSKPDQYITVRFDKIDRDVQITIEDNGKGIPQESQHKVFDMFYRATSEAEGSGLGLFIVKQALDKINAQIILRSELGEGSEFRIIIHGASEKSMSNLKSV